VSLGATVATVLNVSTPLVVNEGTVTFVIKDSTGTIVGTTSSLVSSGAAAATFNPFYPNALNAGKYSINASFGPTPSFHASSDSTAMLTIDPQAALVT
jgi:Bacterial Ig-like domain (group 3)